MAELAKVHPGDVLREEFMAPLGLAFPNVANATGLLQGDLTALVKVRRAVDADIALRLSRFFSTSVRFLLRLQADYGRGCTKQALALAPPEAAAETGTLANSYLTNAPM